MTVDITKLDIEDVRARLGLNHPVRVREGAMLEIGALWEAGRVAECVPLFPEVMSSLRATRIAIESFGDSARPLGVALHTADLLVQNGASLLADHIKELNWIATTQDRSLPNERDAARRILSRAGVAVVERLPVVKPVPEQPLTTIRKALEEGKPDRALFALRKVKAKDVSRDDEMLGLVERVIADERERSQNGKVHSQLREWLQMAKLLLPSPAADRALYASMTDHDTPVVKTRARACLRLIDASAEVSAG